MTDGKIPGAPKMPTRTDSILTKDDREWFANLLLENEKRTNAKIDSLRNELIDVRTKTSSADLEHATTLNRLLLDQSRTAGREGSEASGKKWAAIQAVIALVVTLITSLIAHGETATAPEPQTSTVHKQGKP